MDWTLEDDMVTVDSSAPHSQVTDEAIPHLYKQEQERPRLVRRRLSWTHTFLGWAIPGGLAPVSRMKVRSHVVFSNHSACHW